MNPLISVIVPIFNIERYIGICIESILNQSYKNLEIILVDDGSPDRCGEICDLYASKDSRIHVIHKENGGLVSARKAGILASHGDYIGVVDGDDWIGRGYYQSMISAITNNDADVVIAGFTRDLFSKSQVIHNTILSGTYSDKELEKLYSCMLSYGKFHTYGVTTYLWNKLFKREVVLQCQLDVDEKISIGEDSAVVYPTLLKCRKVCITDNCAYHYRQREDSMLKLSGSYEKEAYSLRILYEYLSDIFGHYPQQYHLQDQLDDWMLGTFIIRSGSIMDSGNDLPLSFPYNKDIHNKRLTICGAGTFGQQLVRRLNRSEEHNIIGWFDDDYWEYRRCCMNVDPLEEISKCEFDYAVIAKLDTISIEEYSRKLLDLGVGKEKIVYVSMDNKVKETALSLYLGKTTGG